MSAILDAILLPPVITAFERNYLRRMNRVGLGFFLVHLPVIVLVAGFNGTDPLFAAALTALVLVGPVLAMKALPNPRHISLVFGFTAMMMGALLVHFGQGPMQIEMHFYFFVLIALLAVYANPSAIIVAAATVALHHLALWFWLPESVFNYAAPIWVVLVHALFVVLESVAACFISRSFFDNVVGLERIVQKLEARNAELRVVLDNVDQVLLTLDDKAVVSEESSKATEEWLGADTAQRRFGDLLADRSSMLGASFDIAWEQVTDGFIPQEIALDQLPRCLESEDGAVLELSYKAIEESGSLSRVLVIGTDITARLRRETLEAEQRETLAIFECISRDRRGFIEFFQEADGIVAELSRGSTTDLTTVKRLVHTLKGNAASYRILTVSEECHDLETGMSERQKLPRPQDWARLTERWSRVRANYDMFIGQRDAVDLPKRSFDALVAAVDGRRPHEDIARMLTSLSLDRASDRLSRFVEQAKGLATRLGKEDIEVKVSADDVSLDPAVWSAFWASFIHAIRNAVDHGFEEAADRIDAGRQSPVLELEARLGADGFRVSIRDNGRGIDWEAVAEKSRERGLPYRRHEDLVAALFTEGLSTSACLSQVSGRGLGMGSLRESCERLGGRIAVSSATNQGTTLTFTFPTALVQTRGFGGEERPRRSSLRPTRTRPSAPPPC